MSDELLTTRHARLVGVGATFEEASRDYQKKFLAALSEGFCPRCTEKLNAMILEWQGVTQCTPCRVRYELTYRDGETWYLEEWFYHAHLGWPERYNR